MKGYLEQVLKIAPQAVEAMINMGNYYVKTEEPEIPSSITGAEIGVTELLWSETSYFYGSSAERIQNIQAASKSFHGLLVAPGEIFSMGEHMADVSLENGFAEALIIFGGRTIKGVGGGVCQVSTTLFRTVFFGGYPGSAGARRTP